MTTLAYNSWLGVTQSKGENSEQMSMTYDSYGRPTSGTSPYCGPGCSGPTASFSYGTSTPFTQTKTGPDGVTTTTLDGLGRAILVARGDTSGVHSYTATTYAPCACSPLAKIQKTSQPYAYGSSASAWTTYTYDGLGRPLTVQQPDGVSTTHYAYSGNVTTVTDPAGNWKQFTTDVSGNLVTVTEPDPSNPPSGTVSTTYTYDWMNHVTGVSMTRAGTTQTRSFVYDSAGRLTSATNPENGTVSYVYGTNNAVQMKTDAKGQQTVYSYDSLSRLTMTQYYPTGTANPEDGCQRVTYSYDTNPYNSTFSQNSYGRLTAVLYGAATGSVYAPGAFCTSELMISARRRPILRTCIRTMRRAE
jgi:YD repeat-containing protein